jgi:hypothetical protein
LLRAVSPSWRDHQQKKEQPHQILRNVAPDTLRSLARTM